MENIASLFKQEVCAWCRSRDIVRTVKCKRLRCTGRTSLMGEW